VAFQYDVSFLSRIQRIGHSRGNSVSYIQFYAFFNI
jgi:hypothetical protein